MLELYGHPFSSYTWKALIPLYGYDIPFTFRPVRSGDEDNDAFVMAASPFGKFPVLKTDGETVIEATAIIEWLALSVPGAGSLVPDGRDGLALRVHDRIYDNYVMASMQMTVDEFIAKQGGPVDRTVIAASHDKLLRAYRWLEGQGVRPPRTAVIDLVDCAAAPALFYADWVLPIPDECPNLQAYRAHLLAIPAVKRCVDDARPFRHYFPPGAPDRD
ncbi:glutathione S-transferase family protein [Parablastomonas sp. CN1-191]|uniref:glutathione S-transferase family protein n=1 Tax=Parablastomonas sp. CN1-191 TaxID=3400908 RepID=UPI003BF894C0